MKYDGLNNEEKEARAFNAMNANNYYGVSSIIL